MGYLREMDVPEKLIALQKAAGPIGIWVKPEDLEPAPAPLRSRSWKRRRLMRENTTRRRHRQDGTRRIIRLPRRRGRATLLER